MQVIEFIKEKGFDALTEELGIKVKHYEDDGLVVLSYSQIDSPKTHPVVRECRGLILRTDTLEVVCRPFYRFFNWGEATETTTEFKLENAIAYDKVDGSLIKIWYNNGVWQIATRGTAFAESSVNGWDITFRELVLRALDCRDYLEFNARCRDHLDATCTYMYEVTSLENKVVTHYEGTTLWFLGCISNETGQTRMSEEQNALAIGAKRIGSHLFNTIEACLNTAAALPDLAEGYVLFDMHSEVRIKVKSPAYVAVHHIRGEGLNPKRIKQLVLNIDKMDEYLYYYPDDEEHLLETVVALRLLEHSIDAGYKANKHHETQKDFALSVKRFCFSGVLFQARAKNIDPLEVWASSEARTRYNILCNFMGE